MACADRFDIEVRGRRPRRHAPPGRRPGAGRRGAGAGPAVGGQPQRRPQDAAVLSVTQFHAGDAYNVIPDVARIGGTVRAFRPELRAQVEDAMQRICAGIGAAFGANVNFEYRRGYPPTINSPPRPISAPRWRPRCAARPTWTPSPAWAPRISRISCRRNPAATCGSATGPGRAAARRTTPLRLQRRCHPHGVAYWVRLAQRWLACGGR